MDKHQYFAPETEIIEIKTEGNFLVYNDSFGEDDDDIFGDGNN